LRFKSENIFSVIFHYDFQEGDHLSIKCMRMQSDGKSSAAPESRKFIFPSESDCGLWLAALSHAMSPPKAHTAVQAPKSPDSEKATFTLLSNLPRNFHVFGVPNL
jgi:hypothetical protein